MTHRRSPESPIENVSHTVDSQTPPPCRHFDLECSLRVTGGHLFRGAFSSEHILSTDYSQVCVVGRGEECTWRLPFTTAVSRLAVTVARAGLGQVCVEKHS